MTQFTSIAVAIAIGQAFALAAEPSNLQSKRESSDALLTDISTISQYWGQISPYRDNEDAYFGVSDVGLPDGCQIEQVHTLQRHAQRFPTGYFDDGILDQDFGAKVYNLTKANATAKFTGPLAFLNSYQYQMTSKGYLTGIGATTEFQSGVSFWNRYGRTLYNATVGQLQYNASYANGTARPKPVLRTTSQSRIQNSEISWALGFFGSSFQQMPDPKFSAFANNSLFDVIVIPEGGTENNTLASYDSCFEDDLQSSDLGDLDLLFQYVPLYIGDATKRMNQYAPKGFTFTNNDTYAMQSICAYETGYLGQSDFCNLFTEDEWRGFEQTLDIEYYYDYSFGSPTGRAQGLGYQQELLARLTNQYITSSNSSVNSSITNNSAQFPLGRPFYADFSHDDIIISVLTSMSVDYFREAPNLKQYPPDPERHFILSHMTPFGGRLITEVIGCSSANPTAQHSRRTQYYPGQYGYNTTNASHKFIRMRLNNGIIPLDTIRTGECEGRTDGMCPMNSFLQSQYTAAGLANYHFACFANYTILNTTNGIDYDGTINDTTGGIVIAPEMITADYLDSI